MYKRQVEGGDQKHLAELEDMNLGRASAFTDDERRTYSVRVREDGGSKRVAVGVYGAGRSRTLELCRRGPVQLCAVASVLVPGAEGVGIGRLVLSEHVHASHWFGFGCICAAVVLVAVGLLCSRWRQHAAAYSHAQYRRVRFEETSHDTGGGVWRWFNEEDELTASPVALSESVPCAAGVCDCLPSLAVDVGVVKQCNTQATLPRPVSQPQALAPRCEETTVISAPVAASAVSYTHLTLPTKRIV